MVGGPSRLSRVPYRLLFTSFCLLLTAYCQLPAYAQSAGGARGKVRNSRGEAISGVKVIARLDSKDVSTATSNSKGEFSFNRLEPGVYNFIFDASGYASAIRSNIEVRRNKTVDLGDRLILLVDKGTLVIIQGSVFFKDGTSVTGAKVAVERVNSDGTTSSLPAVYTNVFGEFTFRQPEGTAKYRFTANYKDRTASMDIEVGSAAIYRLAIKLDIVRSNN